MSRYEGGVPVCMDNVRKAVREARQDRRHLWKSDVEGERYVAENLRRPRGEIEGVAGLDKLSDEEILAVRHVAFNFGGDVVETMEQILKGEIEL